MAKRKDQALDELVAPDPFLEGANQYAGWVEKNLKLVIGGFAGVLAVIGLVLFIQQSSTRNAAKTTSELTRAVEEYGKATDLQKTLTSTNTAELNKTYEKVLPSFTSIIEKEPDHAAALTARLYAADLERRLGHDDKALAHYQAYLAKASKDDVLLFVALEGAGYAAEALNKPDDAIAYFEKLTDLPGGFYKDYGLKHKARILEKKGDKEGAKAAYKQLLADMPDSKLRDFAEQKLSQLD